MKAYYRDNIQLYILFAIWLAAGMFAGPVSYAVIILSMGLMYKKGMYEELLLGYLFILILSDSLNDSLLFAKSVKNIYIGMLAVLFFFDLRNFSPLNNLYKIFLPFFAFSFITILFSVNDPFFFTGIQKTISFAISLIILPSFFTKLYREKGKEFFRRLIFFAITILIAGFILSYVAIDYAYLENGRYRGALGSPNGLGIYCVLIYIAYFILNDFFPEMFSRRERFIVLAAILLSLYLTGSRNSVIAVLIFYTFQRFFSFSPFLGFIIFLISVFLTEIITSNLTSIVLALGLGDFFRVNTLEEGSGRYIAWAFAWQQIQNNFFIGKGFAYNEYYMRQHYGMLSKLGHQGGIHNSFLTFWMDQGLVGLILYLRSYILMFVKAAKKTRYAFPAMFAVSFTAMFESWLVASLSAFAFLAAFIFTIITTDEIIPDSINNSLKIPAGDQPAYAN